MQTFLTRSGEKAIERRFTLQKRAIEILDIVVAEWESDPMSVQCFDLRVVEEAKAILNELKAINS